MTGNVIWSSERTAGGHSRLPYSPHTTLCIEYFTFWRLPVTAFASAWSSTLRSLLFSFTFASLFALTCSSAALSMGRMCRMGHWLPWLKKYLRGKVAGINATRIQLFLPLMSMVEYSTDTELMLRGVRSYKSKLFENRGQAGGKMNHLAILSKKNATVIINLVKVLNHEWMTIRVAQVTWRNLDTTWLAWDGESLCWTELHDIP